MCILDATQLMEGARVSAPVRTPELTCACIFVIIFNLEETIFDPEGVALRGSSSNLTSLLNPVTTSDKQILS